MKTEKKPLEMWAIACASGEIHIDEGIEAFLEKQHAEDGLLLASDYDEECGPHRIVKFREVQ